MKAGRCSRMAAAVLIALTLTLAPAFAAEQTADTTDTQTEQTQEDTAEQAESVDPFADPRTWAVLVVIFGTADVIYMRRKRKNDR